jgi:prolipoprotein diacylglyceryltransferase
LVLAYVAFWGWKRTGGWSGIFGRGKEVGKRFSFAKYIDSIAVCMPLVAGFVRLGNFFNSEIVGRSFDGPWAVVFAQNGENFGRHPVQLYEGLWAWIVFAVVMGLWVKSFDKEGAKKKWARSYFFLFLFIGLYFAGRFGLEFFKEYQIGVGTDGLPWGLTMGQGLSVAPVVVAGAWFVWSKLFK